MTEENNKIKTSIDDKLFKVKYVPGSTCHLKVCDEECAKCTSKICTYICPANVYEWDEERQKLIVGYENCLECGACRIACERKSIDWSYPKGTNGVTFKHG